MSTPYDVAAVFGDVFPIPVPPTAADVTLITSDCRLCGWSLRDATGDIGLQAEAQITSPGAGATIVSVTNVPAGTYDVNWVVSLQGAAAAADANNFQLKNAAVAVVNSINAGAAGAYPQNPARIQVAAGATVSVVAIGAGTVGVVYLAQIQLVPVLRANTVAEVQDVGNILGEVAPPANEDDTVYFGDYGIPCQGQIKLHIISGALTGVVYAKLQR